MKQRVIFKVLLIVLKSTHNLTPPYLSQLINVHVPSRRLRSSNQNCFNTPFTRSSFMKNCAFSIAGPTLFNTLSINIRQAESVPIFKRLLKTCLFHYNFFLPNVRCAHVLLSFCSHAHLFFFFFQNWISVLSMFTELTLYKINFHFQFSFS